MRRRHLAQALDLYDSTLYLHKGARVKAGDYSDLEDASLVIISAGPLPDLTTGETRMDTLSKTVAIIKDIVKNIKTTSYDGLILNISNPADVVTHYLQHELGWDEKKIFSTSTTLDSARLKKERLQRRLASTRNQSLHMRLVSMEKARWFHGQLFL